VPKFVKVFAFALILICGNTMNRTWTRSFGGKYPGVLVGSCFMCFFSNNIGLQITIRIYFLLYLAGSFPKVIC